MNILKSLKDKVTIAQGNYICNMWNGTMFVDLDRPLNASSLLSASAELLVNIRILSVCVKTIRIRILSVQTL